MHVLILVGVMGQMGWPVHSPLTHTQQTCIVKRRDGMWSSHETQTSVFMSPGPQLPIKAWTYPPSAPLVLLSRITMLIQYMNSGVGS